MEAKVIMKCPEDFSLDYEIKMSTSITSGSSTPMTKGAQGKFTICKKGPELTLL